MFASRSAWHHAVLQGKNIFHPSKIIGLATPLGALVGQGGEQNVRALVSEDKPKNGGSGSIPVKFFGATPFSLAKMILRMFKITETMFS